MFWAQNHHLCSISSALKQEFADRCAARGISGAVPLLVGEIFQHRILFYGALLANVVFLPMVTKLQRRSAAEVEQKTLILEGLLSIHAGDNPRILVQKLRAFLAPRERDQDAA